MSKSYPSDPAMLTIIRNCEAIRQGHYFFTRDYHTNVKIATYLIFKDPKYTNLIAKAMYERFKDENVTYVLTPNKIEGYLLAHNIAERFNAFVTYVHREEDQLFLPEICISSNEKVLIVDDGINTGNSLKTLVLIVGEKIKAEIVGASIFLDRYVGTLEEDFRGIKIETLISLPEYPIFDMQNEECPLCKEYGKVSGELREISKEKKGTKRYFDLLKSKMLLELRPAYG